MLSEVGGILVIAYAVGMVVVKILNGLSLKFEMISQLYHIRVTEDDLVNESDYLMKSMASENVYLQSQQSAVAE